MRLGLGKNISIFKPPHRFKTSVGKIWCSYYKDGIGTYFESDNLLSISLKIVGVTFKHSASVPRSMNIARRERNYPNSYFDNCFNNKAFAGYHGNPNPRTTT